MRTNNKPAIELPAHTQPPFSGAHVCEESTLAGPVLRYYSTLLLLLLLDVCKVHTSCHTHAQ